MLNKRFTGVIKAVSVVSKSVKAEDGTKYKKILHQIKLESADIDYESLNEYDINIAQCLLAIQPMPFDTISFPKRNGHYDIFFRIKEEENDVVEDGGFDIVKAEIDKINVVVKENIPTYIFTILIPALDNPNGKLLSGLYKVINEFEISRHEK